MKEQEVYEQFKANIVEAVPTVYICNNPNRTLALGVAVENPDGTAMYLTADDTTQTDAETLDEAFEYIYNQIGFNAYNKE